MTDVTIVADAVGENFTRLNCCWVGRRNCEGPDDRFPLAGAQGHERGEGRRQPGNTGGVDIQERIVKVKSFHLRIVLFLVVVVVAMMIKKKRIHFSSETKCETRNAQVEAELYIYIYMHVFA